MSELTSIRISDIRPAPGFRPLLRSNADAREGANATTAIVTEIDPFAEGYRRGKCDAEREFLAEREQYQSLIAAFETLQPESSEALSLLIAETVEALVRVTVGEAAIDLEKLTERAKLAASLVAESDAERVIFLNPADLELVSAELLPIVAVGDAGIARGSVRVEHPAGWIEHGIEVYLRSLREQLGLKEPRA